MIYSDGHNNSSSTNLEPSDRSVISGDRSVSSGSVIRTRGASIRTAPSLKSVLRNVFGMVAAAALVILNFGKYLILLFKFMPAFLQTGLSILFSLWIYGRIFGWPFATGFIALIFCHEMGHVLAAKKNGLPVTAPFFIPFVGAFIGMNQIPKNVRMEAEIAYGGPFFGSLAALVPFGFFVATGQEFYGALAMVGFFLNLFNLIPVSPLDGGRIMAAISPRVWIIGLAMVLALLFWTGNPILLVILIISFPRALSAWRNPLEQMDYYRISAASRLGFAVAYFGLASFLVFMIHWVDGLLQLAIRNTTGLGV